MIIMIIMIIMVIAVIMIMIVMIVMIVIVLTFHRGPCCYEEHTVRLASQSLQRGSLLTRKPGDHVDGDGEDNGNDGDDGWWW